MRIFKKPLIILLVVLGILAVAVLYILLQPREVITRDFDSNRVVKFRLINGDTKQLMSLQKLLICDDSVEFLFDGSPGSYPMARFCDSEYRKILGEIVSDVDGSFVIDLNQIDVSPPFNIVFDVGESDHRYGIAKVERVDNIRHLFNSSYIRTINTERSGKVISNKFYNLDTNDVREIFTGDGSEKVYKFEMIDLIIYRK